MLTNLFSPIKIRGLELKNRTVLPAMGTKFASDDSQVTQQLIDYHVARVKSGCALNIVEVASVHKPSAPRKFISIADDMYIPGLKKLVDAIHEAGGKASIQLWQGGLAVGSDKAAQIILPSPMPVSETITLPGCDIATIKDVVACYGEAARRAKEAGFDSVEFHCAHNYMPHSFLSGGINHRDDEYGGSFENRMRFPLECIQAIRSNLNDDMPLFMRVGAHDDYLENGLTIEDVIAFCKKAKEEGVDVVDVSRGNIITAGLQFEVPPIDLPRAFNIENAARIKKETGLITMGVGRINTPVLADDILKDKKVDLIGIGRAQLADADYVGNAQRGEFDEIQYCVGCNQGCYDGFEHEESPHITCLRNPAVGREGVDKIEKTNNPKKVVIAGGGIAGLECALLLHERGHIPVIYETSENLGGQFALAGEAPRKAEMKNEVLHMANQVIKKGIEVHLKTPISEAIIQQQSPYMVVNAIGATPIKLTIPGADLPHVKDSHDILAGKERVSGDVVVIGGGMVGIEIAEFVETKGCNVTDLEMLPEIVADLGSTRKITVNENVHRAGIKSITNVQVTRITEDAVYAIKDDKEIEYPCDNVVVAVGVHSRSLSEIETYCRDKRIAYASIGDATKARRAIEATREAYDLALHFDEEERHNIYVEGYKTVFITGGTGTMGQETIKQLLSRYPKFKVRVLARKSHKNIELLKKMSHPYLDVIWGDMNDYDIIETCVNGADMVLHIGAMVSPAADKYPKETLETNIGSTLKIIHAIKKQANADDIRLVYVSTIALTGSRLDPIHWGRCGDPINPSIHDYYAMSKMYSEWEVYESGLKHWVVIRQTGQHPVNESAGNEPIMFHQPVNNVLEWSTSIDSGICMANCCESFVPESFWRKSYNLSSGAGFRFTNWEFMNISTEPMGFKFEDVYDSRYLARFNFHGHWYTDADELDNILHFRHTPADMYFAGVKHEISRLMQNPMVAAMMPNKDSMKQSIFEVGHKEMGSYWMLENNEEDWIKAFFGSKEEQEKIKSFEEGYKMYRPSETPTYLNHGYDETKGFDNLEIKDMKEAASYRGGEVLSSMMKKGDMYTPLLWKCSLGHTFEASPNVILQGGHWCPECQKEEWHYGEIANSNPFYAQVWHPHHKDEPIYHIPMKFSGYEITKKIKEELSKK